MKVGADYGWIILLVFAVIVAVFWKSLTGMFGTVSDKVSNKEQYERGKAVFYDTTRWGGEGSYVSCAMCHAPDFTPDPTKKIEMTDYKPGEPHILKNISSKYKVGVLDTSDELYLRIMKCLTDPTKMYMGRVSHRVQYMQDLMEYVGRQ